VECGVWSQTDSLEVNVLGNQLTDLLLKVFPRLITCIYTSEMTGLKVKAVETKHTFFFKTRLLGFA
jgi:hypothetical protein